MTRRNRGQLFAVHMVRDGKRLCELTVRALDAADAERMYRYFRVSSIGQKVFFARARLHGETT